MSLFGLNGLWYAGMPNNKMDKCKFFKFNQKQVPKNKAFEKSYHAVFSEMNIFGHNRQQIFILGQMKIWFLKYGVVKCSKILSILGTNLSRYIYFEFKCNTKLQFLWLACSHVIMEVMMVLWLVGWSETRILFFTIFPLKFRHDF